MLSFAYVCVMVVLLVVFVLSVTFDGCLLLFVSRCDVCVAVLFVMSWRL